MCCAVYTRKSSEEGLDQEFNSLDAQREACEAYIASQRAEGWLLVPDRYDDGGVSGQAVPKHTDSARRGRHCDAHQPAGVNRSGPKAFIAWSMLKARIESAASAFTALRPRVKNLPPPDIRLIVPKGCSTVHRRVTIKLGSA